MEQHFQILARGAGKRHRTRGSLIDSAVEVFSRDGIAEAKISDITEIAGLANGTFYNHFSDKDDLATETALAIAMELNKDIDAAMIDIDDAVTRIVMATSRFIALATEHKDWGLVLLDGYHQLPPLRANTARYLKADIERGVDQGKFDVTPDVFLLDQIISLIASSLKNQLESGVDEERLKRTCEYVLRLLGLTPARSKRAVIKAQPLVDATEV